MEEQGTEGFNTFSPEHLETLSKEELIARVLALSRDPLTGWLRQESAKQEFLGLVKADPDILNQPITIMAVDLKELGAVNNQFSHEAGDKVIKEFANFMQSYVGELTEKYPFYKEHLKRFILARLYEYGDEFGLIFIGIGWRQQGDIEIGLGEKTLSVEIEPGQEIKVGFRVGFSSSDGDQEKSDLKALRKYFPEDIPLAAEMLNYLRRRADVKERGKRENG